MNLFYYTERKKIEDGEEMELIVNQGFSFNLDDVLMTYPTEKGLTVAAVAVDKSAYKPV